MIEGISGLCLYWLMHPFGECLGNCQVQGFQMQELKHLKYVATLEESGFWFCNFESSDWNEIGKVRGPFPHIDAAFGGDALSECRCGKLSAACTWWKTSEILIELFSLRMRFRELRAA